MTVYSKDATSAPYINTLEFSSAFFDLITFLDVLSNMVTVMII